MRTDGRAGDQLRPVTFTTGYTRHAEGAVLIAAGDTRVLCTATVDENLPRWLKDQGGGQGWVTAEYAMLPRATHTRGQRGPSSRGTEIQRLIGRSLRASVNLAALGERQIIIDCDVLQADGGTRTASITGGYVALALALEKLIDQEVIDDGVWLAPVAAVSVGVVDGAPLLDLDYGEDEHADVDFNVVAAGGKYVEVQGTAEGAAFDRAMLNTLLDLADKGIRELLAMQQDVLGRAK
ncbi:MAG: ribonuclease PH [Anaerolineae bacterium]|nr:ribonuclease PH [Anaerolineae bacterium]